MPSWTPALSFQCNRRGTWLLLGLHVCAEGGGAVDCAHPPFPQNSRRTLTKRFWFHTSRLLNSNIIRSRCMTPKITAHYSELTWFRPWFHLVPHVGKNAKSQLTIGNWFGSWFGSTWFRMLAEGPNLSSFLGNDLVLDLVPLGSEAVKRNVVKSRYQQCTGDPLA